MSQVAYWARKLLGIPEDPITPEDRITRGESVGTSVMSLALHHLWSNLHSLEFFPHAVVRTH